jgi:hypothetical protein
LSSTGNFDITITPKNFIQVIWVVNSNSNTAAYLKFNCDVSWNNYWSNISQLSSTSITNLSSNSQNWINLTRLATPSIHFNFLFSNFSWMHKIGTTTSNAIYTNWYNGHNHWGWQWKNSAQVSRIQVEQQLNTSTWWFNAWSRVIILWRD